MTVIIPKPLHDELLKGYLGRICCLNGINRQIGLEELAAVSNMPLDQMLAEHSMLPLAQAIGKHAKFSNTTRWANVPGTQAMACPSCIRSDARDQFVSYWRRHHHLHGIEWCVVHKEPLHHAPLATMKKLPDLAPLRALERSVEAEIDHPILQRLYEIQSRWLETEQPIHPAAACEVLKDRCADLGLRSSQSGKRPVISDLVRVRLPVSWISRFFPDLLTKVEGDFFQRIDGTGCDRHSCYLASSYALALAVTFESSEDALAALDRKNLGIIAMRASAKRTAAATGQDSAVQDALESFVGGSPLALACRVHDVRHKDLEKLFRSLLRTIPRGAVPQEDCPAVLA